MMTALWFAVLDGARPRVASSRTRRRCCTPINYLLGELDRAYLTTLRAVRRPAVVPVAHQGPGPASTSPPARSGIGATAPLWGAIARRYVDAHFDAPRGGRAVSPHRRRRARRGRRAGRRSPTRWSPASARSCGSSTSTASRSTGSFPTSRIAQWTAHVRGRRLARRRGQVRAAADGGIRATGRRGAAGPDRRHAQRGVPARLRPATPGGRAAVLRRARPPEVATLLESSTTTSCAGLVRDLGGHDLGCPARRVRRSATRRRPADRRLRLHGQGLRAAHRGPPAQPLRAARPRRRSTRCASRGPTRPTTRGTGSTTGAGGGAVPSARPAPATHAAPSPPSTSPADLDRRPADGHRVDAGGVRPRRRSTSPATRPDRARARHHRARTSPRRPTSAAGSTGSGVFAPERPTVLERRTRSCTGPRARPASTSSSGIAEINLVGLLGELGATWSR